MLPVWECMFAAAGRRKPGSRSAGGSKEGMEGEWLHCQIRSRSP